MDQWESKVLEAVKANSKETKFLGNVQSVFISSRRYSVFYWVDSNVLHNLEINAKNVLR
jgi:hypothetical protein